MKLLNLKMENFRQFLGKQKLVFASDPDRNVTLIFGANGTGKTTILNAFTWALYGEFTPDVQHPERVINDHLWESARDGESLEASVSVQFEHRDTVYTVTRTVISKKSGDAPQFIDGNGDLVLVERDATGRSNERKNPSDVVDQILPERLHQFFFFNGERIERLADGSAFAEIEQATKTLLGLEVLERAEGHLTKVSQGFERELRTVGSSEQRELAESLEMLRSQREVLFESRQEVKKNRDATEKRRLEVASRLKELEGARSLQQRRYDLEQGRDTLVAQLERARETQGQILIRKGFRSFLGDLGQEVSLSIGELESKGELPTPIKRPFLAELLERGECICGTHLVEGEAPFSKVSSYSERAGLGEVEQKLIELKAQADYVSEAREELSVELDQSAKLIAETRANLQRQEESLSEVSKSLSEVPSEEIRELEGQHQSLIEEGHELAAESALVEKRIEEADLRLKQEEKNLKNAEAKDEEAALAQLRQSVANEAETVVRSVYTLLKDEVRSRLDERVKSTFKDISYKEREPELNESFELKLWDTAGGSRIPAIQSTGENMLLALSFVGGLASLARDQEERSDSGDPVGALISGKGGTYPIVMDAAFGSLSGSYRIEIARALPRLAAQAIVLVSKDQGEGVVSKELEGRVGSAYSIAYHTLLEGEDDEIFMNGRSYPHMVSTNDGIERAELVQMKVPR